MQNQSPSTVYLKVIPLAPINRQLTYALKGDRGLAVQPGCRVLVPLGKRQVTGVVASVMDAPDFSQVRDVVDVLDPEPVVSGHLLELTAWVADYYVCTHGEALRAAMPAGFASESRQYVVLTGRGRDLLLSSLHPLQKKILGILQSGAKKTAFNAVKKAAGKKDVQYHLAVLEQEGLITVQRDDPAAVTARTEKHAVLKEQYIPQLTLDGLKKRAPKQKFCLDVLQRYRGEAPLSQLYDEGISYAVVKGLEKKDFLSLEDRPAVRDPLADMEPVERVVHAFTDDQQRAYDHILASVDARQYRTHLMHGVTGSGKTEVYIRLCEQVLARGRQAILLVPEISLTPQMVRLFRAAFPDDIALFHSRLSAGERYDTWHRVRRGECRVVIGARSAVFAPCPSPGIIIIDEEQEGAFKQFDSTPRYHARDTAVVRARMVGAVVVLGSATPSVDTFYNAVTGKYALETLPVRIRQSPLPEVSIVDMRKEREAKNFGIFSHELAHKMEGALLRGEQVILMQNRRGFSSFLQCKECGHTFECKHCKVTLTYHLGGYSLQCHYCGYRVPAPDECPECRSTAIKHQGVGTEKIEEELRAMFPDTGITRMDMDTTSQKWAHYRLLEQVRTGKSQILLGTQMIAKGLDFPGVTLTGVISADIGLALPDFRAEERTFQLLTQIAGRTGRGEERGEVVIQTYSPQEHSIECAREHDYRRFYDKEIKDRKAYGYPPFNRLALVRLLGIDNKRTSSLAVKWGDYLKNWFKSVPGAMVLGPAPAPISRLKNRFRWQVAVKCADSGALHTALRRTDEALRNVDKQVRATIDVDPGDML